jgi:hypothetical protein
MDRIVVAGAILISVTVHSLGCSHPAIAPRKEHGLSLAAAETLHQRLTEECAAAGAAAIYSGSLSYRLLGGITPDFHSGRWELFPIDKIAPDGVFTPCLAKQTDMYLSLEASGNNSGNSIAVVVGGERIFVSVRGATWDWHFPLSARDTIESVVVRCGDDKRRRPSL